MNARQMSTLVKAVEDTANALTPHAKGFEGWPNPTPILWTLVEMGFAAGHSEGLRDGVELKKAAP